MESSSDKPVLTNRKLEYATPKLVRYGDLRRLTKAKGGGNPDGGGPATKTPPA